MEAVVLLFFLGGGVLSRIYGLVDLTKVMRRREKKNGEERGSKSIIILLQ